MNNYDNLMRQNFMIGVPTRGRVHRVEAITGIWKYFLRGERAGIEYPLYAFVREDEEVEYRQAFQGTYVQLVVVPNTINIAEKRNFIYEYGAKLGKTHVFIINDDVDMYFRKESLTSKYTNKYDEVIENGIVDKMLLESILMCNEQYPITGFPLKQASQGAKYSFEKNKQIIHIQCYHVPTLKKEGIQHDGMGVCGMSDRWVQLSLLYKGYRTITNCRYAVGDAGTGQAGGCTIFRTAELVSEAATAVHKNFPEVVELKTKTNGIWDVARLDCTIYLKKLLKQEELPYIPLEEGLEILRKGGMKV